MSTNELQLKQYLPRSQIVKLLGPNIRYNEILGQIVEHIFHRIGGQPIEGGIHGICKNLGLIGKNNVVSKLGMRVMYHGLKERLGA